MFVLVVVAVVVVAVFVVWVGGAGSFCQDIWFLDERFCLLGYDCNFEKGKEIYNQ